MNIPLSRRGRIRLMSYLAAVLLVLGGACLSLLQSNRAYRRATALSEQRAFSQLTASVDKLDSALQKQLYVVTPAMISVLSAEIQAEAAAGQMAIGELPYANIELENTAAFLAKAGDYASALARSAAANGGLSPEEQETLSALSTGASQLKQRLDALEQQLNEGSVSLSDARRVESRLSQLGEDGDVLAGSEFQDLESEFPELPVMTYDGPFSQHLTGRTPLALEGLAEVDETAAVASAAAFTGLRGEIFSLDGTVEGEIPAYTLSAAVDGAALTVQISKAGGAVIALSNSRAVYSEALSREEGLAVAADFLTSRGYPGMMRTYDYCADGRLTVNFAWAQGDVLCYPDLIHVTVALDTGSIVGFESTGYLTNHTERALPAPAVSQEQAQQNVSPRLDVLSARLSLIPTEGEYEVLCWEFLCQAENGQHYIACINAQTGAEQKLLILLEDENGTLAL